MKPQKIYFEYEKDGNVHFFEQKISEEKKSFCDENISVSCSFQNSRLIVTADPKSSVVIRQVYAEGSIENECDKYARYFLNGYQSWTDCREYSYTDKEKTVGHMPESVNEKFSFPYYGDYTFCGKKLSRGNFHGWTYAYVRKGASFEFAGSFSELNCASPEAVEKSYAFALIKFFTKKNTFQIFCDGDGIEYEVSSPKVLIDVVFLSGTEDEVFDRYFEMSGISKPSAKPVMGWTSWYDFYQNINEGCLNTNIESIEQMNKSGKTEVPFTVFQIDDGYEPFVGDWLTVNPEKFPNGLAPVVSKALAANLKPGIWVAPFAAETKSELAAKHPEWLCRWSDGKPALCGCNWSGFYGLDIYNEEVRQYVRDFCHHLIDELGFKLLKIDFLYACCLVPHKDKTRGQVMHDAMVFFREASKGAELLGCGVPLGSAFGLVDYCRIGTDVSLSWNDKLYMQLCHRERPSTKYTILNSIYRRQLDGRAFLNDPDVFLLRSYNEKLGQGRKSLLSEINALFGSLVFTSDNPATYDSWQSGELKKVTALTKAKVTSVENKGNIVTIEYELAGEKETLSFNRKNGR